MRNIIKDNKWYVTIVVAFLVFSIGYKLYKENNTNYTNKEVVNLVLQDGGITDGLIELVDEFNLKNKDVQIDFDICDKDYINVAITKLVNQRKIDIFQYFDSFLVDKEEISNLNNLNIDYSKIDNGAAVKLNNEVVGVKYGSSVPKMIINKEILYEAGIKDFNGINTYEELIDIAKKVKENVPGVTPIGISTANEEDNSMMIGMPSAMNSNIYSTFWNYKEGKYTFDETAKTLEMYRNLYENKLINEDFNIKDSKTILEDFTDKKVAITFNQYYNKDFLMENASDMDITLQNMPVFSESDLNKRYYYSDNKILVIRNYDKDINIENIDNHKKAVKEVYEWLMSDDVTSKLIESESNFASFNKSNKINKSKLEFSEFNENTNFEHEILDPTIFMAVNKYYIRDIFAKLIKGEDNINSELIKLEETINSEIENQKESMKVNLDMYKEQE
ncbi:ABC transporter substrate-binding protein [Clostridium gasigenes]|uniref:Carbohydrate ABC transporter substrate-binding protein n=1 Tax=Clostridium gasigenes TaxID=94869 RepID=A0A7X0SC82_9CLOT|nr:ABC transporter substrate-binding protein [Clostridium gasigenes]MBB6713542.1 carbohydrate ABC transporter substrate-binding protein [Clostridium gasigenes]